MKMFCESLREHVINIVNSKWKIMKILIKERKDSYENAKICYICKEKFENKYLRVKKIVKLEIAIIIRRI